MKLKISRRTSFGLGATLSVTALAAAGLGVSGAGAHAIAHKAASTTPSAKVVAPAKNTKGVTLRIGDQAGTGAEAVLQAAGLLNKLPFKVTWADFTSGPPILEAISAGALDIGGVGDAPPVFADPTAKLAIVGALHGSNNNAALIVPGNSPITSISQLAGKTIAVAEGSSADYHLLTVLKAAGLTPSDVTLDYLSPAEGLAALQAGQVAAWDVWSPFIEEAESEGDRVLVGGKGYGSPYSYQVASETALHNANKVAAIQIYLKTLDRAYIWVASHPTVWARSWASATGLPLDVMAQATLDDPQTPIPVTSNIVVQEQGLVNAFASAGLIPAKYNFAPYVTSAFAGTVPITKTVVTTGTTTTKKPTKPKK